MKKVVMSRKPRARSALMRQVLLTLSVVGPGLITANVDNDATGITGYSLAGAQYGYGLLWAIILVTISLAVVQEMVARMGVVTGKGLADLIRERFGVRITFWSMLLLLIANIATTVAEFAGVAGAMDIFGVSPFIAVPVAALVVWFLVVRGSYKYVERILLALCLIYVSYVASGFLVHPDWGMVFHQVVVPPIQLNQGYLLTLVGVIGTTIAPWMQFYQQSAIADKQIPVAHLSYERIDTYVGSFLTDFVAFFIVVSTGATLFIHHIQIHEAKDAALALQPLVGNGHIAEILFAVGLLNASLMAASVLPLSTAYSIAEAFGWERGVGRTFKEAPQFLFLYTFIIIVGAGITLLVPKDRLVFVLNLPNVVGGMLLPLVLILMILLCNDRRLMGHYVNGHIRNVIAWLTTIIMTVLTLLIIVSTLFPGLFGSP
ncbi:MAG TPA: Nramp family divalent metal transporter [Ktedonobacteraceae bacterium]|jgi:Mn2+/Fe2+ NRAMP family transporter|nr:Nramp family divalent metal transporter [Ktedonobacteraceae bacterium]